MKDNNGNTSLDLYPNIELAKESYGLIKLRNSERYLKYENKSI